MYDDRETAPLTVKVKRLAHGADLDLPRYETALAAGCDVRAAVDAPVTLAPGERAMIPTGIAIAMFLFTTVQAMNRIAIAMPPGWEAQMRPRSGLAARHGIACVNAPGTIDADYRGELKVILINHGGEAFTVSRGARIGQLVFAPVFQATFEEVEDLDETERGEGGFGSTGV